MLMTIAICTFNRADHLARCLDSVCQSARRVHGIEILVIDNNSADHTKKVVKEFADRGVRYIQEGRQGLSYARNTAIRNASGKFIAFTDDDCRLPEHWLARACTIAMEKDSDIFGGPRRACFESPKPAWYKEEYGSYLQGAEEGPLPVGKQFTGDNIVLRRSMIVAGDAFRTDLGMKGQKIGYGEETELVMRLLKTGTAKTTYYDPHLYVHHVVRPVKMTMRWQVMDAWVDGLYERKIFGSYKKSDKTNAVVTILMWKLLAMLCEPLRIITRNKEAHRHWQNYVYEETVGRIRDIGYYYADLSGGQ